MHLSLIPTLTSRKPMRYELAQESAPDSSSSKKNPVLPPPNLPAATSRSPRRAAPHFHAARAPICSSARQYSCLRPLSSLPPLLPFVFSSSLSFDALDSVPVPHKRIRFSYRRRAVQQDEPSVEATSSTAAAHAASGWICCCSWLLRCPDVCLPSSWCCNGCASGLCASMSPTR